MELPFEVEVHASCPPGEAYLVDPAYMADLLYAGGGIDEIEHLVRKSRKARLIVSSEAEGERVRRLGEAAMRSGRIKGLFV